VVEFGAAVAGAFGVERLVELFDGVVGPVAAGRVGAVVLAVEPVEPRGFVAAEGGVVLVEVGGGGVPEGGTAGVGGSGSELAYGGRGAVGVVAAGVEVGGDSAAGLVELGGPAGAVGSLPVEVS
jgi:hypothetical protein